MHYIKYLHQEDRDYFCPPNRDRHVRCFKNCKDWRKTLLLHENEQFGDLLDAQIQKYRRMNLQNVLVRLYAKTTLRGGAIQLVC